MKRTYVSLSMLVVIGLALSFTYYTPPTLSSNNHDELKMLTQQKWGNEPVKLTEVRVNGKSIVLGDSFSSNESDWIRELSFKVRNTSTKEISHARFELQFPLKDTPRKAFFVQPLEYDQTSSKGAVAPGETFELSVELNVDVLKQMVRENGVGKYLKINMAQLSSEVIEFTDKTMWVAGAWFRFNNQTKKWMEMIPTRLDKLTDSPPDFQLVSFKAPQSGTCFSSLPDFVDCPSDCQCGVRHNIATPGDIRNVGNFQADKIQVCCTQNGVQCVVAYDGVAPNCPHP